MLVFTPLLMEHLNHDSVSMVTSQKRPTVDFSLLFSWYFKSGWMSLIYKAFLFFFYYHIHTCVTNKKGYIHYLVINANRWNTNKYPLVFTRTYARVHTHTFLPATVSNRTGSTLKDAIFPPPTSVNTAHAPNKSGSFDTSCPRKEVFDCSAVWIFASNM